MKLETPSDVTKEPMIWLMGLKVDTLTKNLEKAGLTEDTLEEIVDMIGSMMYF